MKNKLLVLLGISCLSFACLCGCGKNTETVSGNADSTIGDSTEDEELSYAEKAKTGIDLEIASEYDPTGVTKPIRIPDDIIAEQIAAEEKAAALEKISEMKENESQEEVVDVENETSGYDIDSPGIKKVNNGIDLNKFSVSHFDYKLPIKKQDSPFVENTLVEVDMKNVSIDSKLFKFDGTAYSPNTVNQYVVYCDVDDEDTINGMYVDCNFFYKLIEDGKEKTIDYDKYYIPEVEAGATSDDASENDAAGVSQNDAQISENDAAENKDEIKAKTADDKKVANNKELKEEESKEEGKEEAAKEDPQQLAIKKRKDFLRSFSICGISLGMTKTNVESVIGKGVVVDGLYVYKNNNGSLIISYEKNKNAYLGDEFTVYQIAFLSNSN